MNSKIYSTFLVVSSILSPLLNIGNIENRALALEPIQTTNWNQTIAPSLKNSNPNSLNPQTLEPSDRIPDYLAPTAPNLTSAPIDVQVNSSINSVSQLSDIKTTDWAFTALQSLVERYGCIAGYPDQTYRGKQAISRYEFAAGLNTCLDKINEIISAGLADKISQTDLATLKKLQAEFAPEISMLRGRVEALEAKSSQLAAQQFSPTTKLNILSSFNPGTSFSSGYILAEGLPIPGSVPVARFAARNPITGSPIVGTITDKPNPTLSYSTYLLLTSSFTGSDSLNLIDLSGNKSSV